MPLMKYKWNYIMEYIAFNNLHYPFHISLYTIAKHEKLVPYFNLINKQRICYIPKPQLQNTI